MRPTQLLILLAFGATTLVGCSASVSLGTGAEDPAAEPEPTPTEEPASSGGAEIRDKQVIIRDRIRFDLNAATLRPISHEILDDVAQLLKEHENITAVRIEGHTDTQGSAARNRELSAERAEAVAQYLLEKGVPQQLTPVGLGSERTLCDEDTEQCHQRNRRVEFHIVNE